MTLTPIDGPPGRWSDPTQRGGLFALLIGVSSYTHASDGQQPADETYGLGQLPASALTAFRMFEFLRDGYELRDQPLARCWLLLSPSNAELAAEPAIATTSYAPATFDSCEQAIGEWFASMRDIGSADAAAASRALFLFSGHGLEVTSQRQILLPSDYLAPPLNSVNRAMSLSNLRTGLRALAVGQHMFFSDACRNDHPRLHQMNVAGTAILNEHAVSTGPVELEAPLLHASAAGGEAFSPADPSRGSSFFGQALLEGLRGVDRLELACDNTRCRVNLLPLARYAQRRVEELLTASGTRKRQRLRFDSTPLTPFPLNDVPHPRSDGGLESLSVSPPLRSTASRYAYVEPPGTVRRFVDELELQDLASGKPLDVARARWQVQQREGGGEYWLELETSNEPCLARHR